VFFLALAGWSAVRLVVASTWRDPVVFGPVRAEQLIASGVMAGSLVLLGIVVTRRGSADVPTPEPELPGVGSASA
jgi:hypothetical protein